jgi:hypothetical protein
LTHPTAGAHPAVFDSVIIAGATLRFYLSQDELFRKTNNENYFSQK